MATPVLNFRIGDETRPKIEVLEKENIQDAFFYEVYQKAFRLIDDILSAQTCSEPLNDESQVRNNIIAFVGDRGSGKTSSMKTVYNTLINNNIEPYKTICEKLIARRLETNEPILKKFAELPVIDPSYFEDKTNLVEIVVTHMFSKFKEHISKPNEAINSFSSEIQEKKQELISRFQHVKDCLDTIHGETEKIDDSIDSLANLAEGIHLKSEFNKLITAYLKFFRHDTLVIAIDDIDLHTRHAYQMIEQMRKYLIQPNVIILAGVKISQLNDLIKQHYYQDYKDLIDRHSLSDTIEDMSGRYLSKLFPLNQRIMMPDLNQRWNCSIRITKDGKPQNEDKSITEVCMFLIFNKTKYMFYCAENNPPLIVPRNLRDLLNFISFLYQMPEIGESDTPTQLDQNRRLFKNYFINTWCREHLSNKMFTFIKDLETTDITDINKSVIDFLTQIPENKDIKLEKTITYKSNRGYNVSLGDAMYVLDKTSNNNTIPYIHHFTAAIKTFYTFLLTDLVDEEITDRFYDKFQDSGDSTKSAPNSNPIPIQLKKLNKLNNIPNYGKLLGGNIIRVAQNGSSQNDTTQNDSNQNKEKNKNSAPKHPFIHLHLINNLQLTKEYEKQNLFDLFVHPLSRLSKDDIFNLNLYEFLILTSYLNTDNVYFRSQKHCPYYATLDDEIINISDPIVYSSTAILFNIIKIYDLYRLFKMPKQAISQEQIQKSRRDKNPTWRDFFIFIDGVGEQSLIYRILHYEDTDNQDNAKESYESNGTGSPKFRNPNIEKLFIRNMDTYDALMDYLPYMKSQYKEGQRTKYRRILWNFYKKLSEYQYYEYLATETKYATISFKALTPIVHFLGDIVLLGNRATFRSIFVPKEQEQEQTEQTN